MPRPGIVPGLRRLSDGAWRSPVLRFSVVYALSGTGFALANLLLARALPPREYGTLTLFVTLMGLGGMLGPLGADGVVNRLDLPADWRLLSRLGLTSTLVAIATVGVGILLYDMEGTMLAVLAAGVVAYAVAQLAAAWLQSRHRFGASILASQSVNGVLLATAVLALLLDADSHEWLILLIVCGQAAVAVTTWFALLGRPGTDGGETRTAFPWRDALAYLGMASAGLVLMQIERLVIPGILSLEELALYGVVASVVIAPFRPLQLAAGYTLLPRLRRAGSAAQRRRLLLREAGIVGVVIMGGSVAIWFLAPWVAGLIVGDKYVLSGGLILAALVSGAARALSGFAKASATALASTRRLVAAGGTGWISVAAALLGAWFGARWGLVGLIYGTTCGWLLRSAGSFILVAPQLVGPGPSRRADRGTVGSTSP